MSGSEAISPASLASWSSPPVTVGASWAARDWGRASAAGAGSSVGRSEHGLGLRGRRGPARVALMSDSGRSTGPVAVRGASAPPSCALLGRLREHAAAAGVRVPLDRRLGERDGRPGRSRPGSVPRAAARRSEGHRGPRFVGAARPPRSCKRSCGLCCPRFASNSRPPPARVGRGGGRHRDAARPAPAEAPAAGRVRTFLAGARRARARRAPLAAARRGHLALQMWAYFAHFDMPDDDPDALLRRLKVDYPIRFDRALGLGTPPTIRLQRALGREGRVGPARVRAVGGPLELVPRAARDARLHPAAPPRALPALGGDDGRLLRPRLRRLLARADGAAVVGGRQREACRRCGASWPRRASDSGDASGTRSTIRLQGNPFAAMPSLHFGTSVMAARILSQVGPGQAALGWAYALTLGFGLVYLGEHYVIDLLAGLALAEAIWRVAPRAEPVVRVLAGVRAAAGATSRLMRTEERRIARRAPARAPRRGARARAGFRGGRGLRRRRVRRRVPGAARGSAQAVRRRRRGRAAGVRDLRRLPEAGRPRRRRPQARQRGLVLDRHRDRVQRGRVRRLRRPVPRHPRRHAQRRRASAPGPTRRPTRSRWPGWRPRASSRRRAPAGSC